MKFVFTKQSDPVPLDHLQPLACDLAKACADLNLTNDQMLDFLVIFAAFMGDVMDKNHAGISAQFVEELAKRAFRYHLYLTQKFATQKGN